MRIIVLPALGVAALFLGFYGAIFLPAELAQAGVPNAMSPLAAIACTALVLLLAFALPIRTLFPQSPVKAAVFVGAFPVLGCFAYGSAYNVAIGFLFFLAIAGGTWGAARLK